MYSCLLVATPFIMLQSFLQVAVGNLSRVSFTLAGLEIPIIPLAALLVAVALGALFRKWITIRLLVAGATVVLMDVLAQQVADYYFDHTFYDLQQNWHYLAYGLFTYMMLRDLAPRKIPLARMMQVTFVAALVFSSFDETFQMHLSNRIFDMGDIAKDCWGTVMGMVLFYGGSRHSEDLLADWRKIRHAHLRTYWRHPFTLLLMLVSFGFILLNVSSLLTEAANWPYVIALSVGGFLLLWIVIHISQYRLPRYALIVLLVVVVGAQGWAFMKYRNAGVVHTQFCLTVYRGFAVPFFDVMIFPDGSFRPVDKKHFFNFRDQAFFLRHETDILLIGSGTDGNGGLGFPERRETQFIYNECIQRGTQVIILKTAEAAERLNKLRKEGKSVLCILHSSC